jgi:hypothetical protein
MALGLALESLLSPCKTSPQEMLDYMKANTPRWAALVKEIGARID